MMIPNSKTTTNRDLGLGVIVIVDRHIWKNYWIDRFHSTLYNIRKDKKKFSGNPIHFYVILIFSFGWIRTFPHSFVHDNRNGSQSPLIASDLSSLYLG
jgi:hypothetical protein